MSGNTTTPARVCLADMELEKLRAWLLDRQKRLVTHKRFVQQHLNHRQLHHHGKQSYADRQYYRFQALADDLLELLEGVICNIDQEMQAEADEQQQA